MALHKQLENLYLFSLVAEHGSFQGAADAAALPRSSVSKRIASLEQQLNVRLIERSTRKLALTDRGMELLKSTEKLQEVLSYTEQLQSQQHSTPQGKVKISISTLMAERFLLPRLAELSLTYPNICLELNVSDDIVDLIENHIDIAIRIGHLPDSSLLAKKVGEKSFAWFASPQYLVEYGTPTSPKEMVAHRCVVFKNKHVTMDKWTWVSRQGEITTQTVVPNILADDARSLVELAVKGMGIIMVDPNLIIKERQQGALVALFDDYQHPDNQPIHLVCLGKKGRSPAVQAVWEHLSQGFVL